MKKTNLFFSNAQFQTYVSVIEAIIETDENVISAEEVASRMDVFLSEVESPTVDQLGLIFFYVKYFMPFFVWRLPPFHRLSVDKRRASIRKFITKKHIFRDIARALKVLTCVPYYSSVAGRKQVGFVDFENRSHFNLKNTQPSIHEEN